MQVKYYNSGNNQWENTNPLPPDEIYIGDTPPAQGINAKLWLDTSVTGLLPASYAVADNCEQTVAGQAVLDAHQGKLLQDQIDVLDENFNAHANLKWYPTYRGDLNDATYVGIHSLYNGYITANKPSDMGSWGALLVMPYAYSEGTGSDLYRVIQVLFAWSDSSANSNLYTRHSYHYSGQRLWSAWVKRW